MNQRGSASSSFKSNKQYFNSGVKNGSRQTQEYNSRVDSCHLSKICRFNQDVALEQDLETRLKSELTDSSETAEPFHIFFFHVDHVGVDCIKFILFGDCVSLPRV